MSPHPTAPRRRLRLCDPTLKLLQAEMGTTLFLPTPIAFELDELVDVVFSDGHGATTLQRTVRVIGRRTLQGASRRAPTGLQVMVVGRAQPRRWSDERDDAALRRPWRAAAGAERGGA